jgi:hypothetical protein
MQKKVKNMVEPSNYEITETILNDKPIPVAVPPKMQVCSNSMAGIAGWNPAEGMDVRLFCLLRVV